MRAIDASPKPVIVCIKQDFPEEIKNKNGLCGGNMTTAMKALGTVGIISDGPSRDVDEIRPMDTIHKLQGNGVQRVKISDISDSLAIPRPGVTRTVKEMEEKCYLKKISSDEDARITYIEITVKGEELSEKYDKNYYSRLCRYLDGITEEEADCMINTIEKFYKVMSERRVDIE